MVGSFFDEGNSKIIMEDSAFRKKLKDELSHFIAHPAPAEPLFELLKEKIIAKLQTRNLSPHKLQDYIDLLDYYAQKQKLTASISENVKQATVLKMLTALYSIYLATNLFEDTDLLKKMFFIGLIDSIYAEPHFTMQDVLALNRRYTFYDGDEIVPVTKALVKIHAVEFPYIVDKGIQPDNKNYEKQKMMLELIHNILKDNQKTQLDLTEIKPDEKSDRLSEILGFIAYRREILLTAILERFAFLTFFKYFPNRSGFIHCKLEFTVESLLIHVCIADKIGFRWAKARIEDEVLKLANPDEFMRIRNELKATISRREEHIQTLIHDIEKTYKADNQKAVKKLLKVLKSRFRKIKKLNLESPEAELIKQYHSFLISDLNTILDSLKTEKNNISTWFAKANQLTEAEVKQLKAFKSKLICLPKEKKLQNILNQTRSQLRDSNLVAIKHIFGRPKNIFSIYRKEKERKLKINQHHDLIGIRIIVDDSSLFQKILLKCNKIDPKHKKTNKNYAYYCYNALSVIQSKYSQIAKFKDFIKAPKCNGYQSLHIVHETKEKNFPFIEIQIRDTEMERLAEYGLAAHWIYDRAGKKSIVTNSNLSNGTILREKYSQKFDKIITVMTDKYDIKKIPTHSTALDFAYYLDPDLGNHCSKVYVNDHLVSFDTILRDGDQIKIACSDTQKPTTKWLKFVNNADVQKMIRRQINYSLPD